MRQTWWLYDSMRYDRLNGRMVQFKIYYSGMYNEDLRFKRIQNDEGWKLIVRLTDCHVNVCSFQ